MRHILVLGYFGYHTNRLDGQTVKTRDVYKLLKEEYADTPIEYFDTQDFKYNRLSPFLLLRKLLRCNHLIYLPAHRNLKRMFPFIYILSKLAWFKIDYFVVGGWLNNYLTPLPIHRRMLRHIKGIHVETKRLQSDLRNTWGFKNIDIFPNFRFLSKPAKPTKNFEYERNSDKLSLVFVARVTFDKGLDTLLKVAQLIDQSNLSDKISIDFYGEKIGDYFDKHLSDIPFFTYKGILPSEKVIEVIGNYDALIFPSHYEGEGCPGIFVEALIAGLPIIASNWKYNSEFVTNHINGFLCDTYNAQDYLDAIESLRKNPFLKHQYRLNTLKQSEAFTDTNARKLIKSIMNRR